MVLRNSSSRSPPQYLTNGTAQNAPFRRGADDRASDKTAEHNEAAIRAPGQASPGH